MIRGSYANGFAPRDGQPRYPSLWRGCVGAWNPGLGPSGGVLRDWSGLRNSGTLTNFSLDTGWSPSEGKYSLLFDGTNDRVTTSVLVTAPFTAIGWIYMFALPSASLTKEMLSTRVGSSGFELGVQTFSGNFWYFSVLGTTRTISPATPNPVAGKWYCIAGTFDVSGNVEMFVDGVSIGTATSGVMAAGSVLTIGSLPSGSNQIAANLDDQKIYNRVLSKKEITQTSLRRGIAYELATRRRSGESIAAFNRRRRLLTGVA